MKFALVFLGGGLGSTVRYAFAILFSSTDSRFPWATLAANALAAVLIGLCSAMDLKPTHASWWMLCAVGFCGGLSTFSTFGLETVQLYQQGHIAYALLNVALSILLGIGLVYGCIKLFS
jgi:CrcB protein